MSRHSNTIEIRQTYKQLSKKYHPDKNPGKDYEDLFQKIKQSYDILMDEEKREIYNRFGLNEIEFDPRKDEMKLFGDLGIKYLFWGILMYIMTATPGAKASRTWNYIVGIILLALEFFLLLSETKLPQWGVFNMYLTEYELLMWIHTLFPAVIASLRILAEYLYVDVDTVTIMVYIKI